MNISELIEALKAKGVQERDYQLDPNGLKEYKVSLEFSEGLWQVFYTERGMKHDLATFETEAEACENMLSRF